MRKKKKTEAWGAAYFPSSNPPAVDSNLSKKKKNKENKTIALGGVFFFASRGRGSLTSTRRTSNEQRARQLHERQQWHSQPAQQLDRV